MFLGMPLSLLVIVVRMSWISRWSEVRARGGHMTKLMLILNSGPTKCVIWEVTMAGEKHLRPKEWKLHHRDTALTKPSQIECCLDSSITHRYQAWATYLWKWETRLLGLYFTLAFSKMPAVSLLLPHSGASETTSNLYHTRNEDEHRQKDWTTSKHQTLRIPHWFPSVYAVERRPVISTSEDRWSMMSLAPSAPDVQRTLYHPGENE